jgi:uncharacterized damage-inducible protein DinB
MREILARIFRYKAWADDQLLVALAALNRDSPVTALALKALGHSYVVDRIFAAHLRRRDHGFTSANPPDPLSLEDLSAKIRSSDQDFLDFLSKVSVSDLAEPIDFTFTDGAPGRMTREEMLVHVITHGIGHRGQVSAVLLLNSLTPPADGFTTFLHLAEAETRRRAAWPFATAGRDIEARSARMRN